MAENEWLDITHLNGPEFDEWGRCPRCKRDGVRRRPQKDGNRELWNIECKHCGSLTASQDAMEDLEDGRACVADVERGRSSGRP